MTIIERQAMGAAARVIREAISIGEELRKKGCGFRIVDHWGRDASELAAELERRAGDVNMTSAAARADLDANPKPQCSICRGFHGPEVQHAAE